MDDRLKKIIKIVIILALCGCGGQNSKDKTSMDFDYSGDSSEHKITSEETSLLITSESRIEPIVSSSSLSSIDITYHEAIRISSEYPHASFQGGIVFYGASNFTLWKEMKNDMSEYRLVNAGFGGSNDTLLREYANQIVFPYHPSILVVNTSSNDYLNNFEPLEEVASNSISYKKEMFSYFHAALPDTKIIIMSGLLSPGRSYMTSLTKEINKRLNEYSRTIDYLFFVDADSMTFDGSKYRNDLFETDGVHLNRTGQITWKDDYIKPEIESLIDTFPNLDVVLS